MKIIKDKFLSAVVLTAAALCTSCSTDSLTPQQQGQNEAKGVSLTATMDEAVTRAGIGKSDTDGKALCYWHKGDQISVQTVKTSGDTYSSAKFYTTDATGATTATFWSEPLSEETLGKYALYPYNEKHQFTSETELTYNLPASYTYTTVGTDIFSNTADGTYPSNSTNVPLLGTVDSENNKITFSHLGGLVVIRIDAMPYEAGTLTVSADQQLSGNFKVNLSAGGQVLATTSTETAADKQVAFTFSGATKDGVGVFYLPVATGDYTNLTIGISDSDGTNNQSIPYGTLSMTQANVWAISLTTHDGNLRNLYDLGDGRYRINGHVFVDLGLPSGLLWATMNIGASDEADYGNYYAWGETRPNGYYTWNNYKYGSSTDKQTKYYSGDSKTILETEDDAATTNWGTACRMPTNAEFLELIDNCTWTWTNKSTSSNQSINGIEFTGKDNKSIFIPASGIYDSGNLADGGKGCNYWSRTLNPTGSYQACILYYLHDNTTNPASGVRSRYRGCSVRPVVDLRISHSLPSEMESMNSNGFFEGWE